ncbi:MAG: POTRA domain-containing protein [Ginsengibacter sp.]
MKKKSLFIIGRKSIAIFVVGFISVSAHSQEYNFYDSSLQKDMQYGSASKLRLGKVVITGNKKTKSYIILREMQIRAGDAIFVSQIPAELEKARNLIYNTTLFVEVTVTPVSITSYDFTVMVDVKERWYIFPIPAFQLADRSFNEWVDTYSASLKRVSYGMRFYHMNVSGRKDQFSFTLINGFTRNISFDYRAPYSNPALSEGVLFSGGFLQTREIPYQTNSKNNIIYFKNDEFVKNEWFVSGAYLSRKGLKKKETFSLTFRHLNVDDSIISQHYNPGYFNSKSSDQNFLELEYKLQFIEVDNIVYPLKGYTTSFIVNKRGIQPEGNINRLSLKVKHNIYFKYPHKWYSSFRFSGESKLPFTQSYINRRSFGYGDDYLRGDEYFVIDGVVSALAKFDLKKQILKFYVPTSLKSKTYDRIPFTVYAKTFADLGYAYIQPQFDTRLNNRLLYSGGFGIDIVTLYDFKLNIDCSFNQLGQKGLFLHN